VEWKRIESRGILLINVLVRSTITPTLDKRRISERFIKKFRGDHEQDTDVAKNFLEMRKRRICMDDFDVATVNPDGSRVLNNGLTVKANEYIVEDIIGHKKEEDKLLYLIKWRDYVEPTWEPTTNLRGFGIREAMGYYDQLYL
jgi:hypothetical protein